MAAETPGSGQGTPVRGDGRAWLRVAAVALALLGVSEALWLWQTWPVRELLGADPAPASSRQP